MGLSARWRAIRTLSLIGVGVWALSAEGRRARAQGDESPLASGVDCTLEGFACHLWPPEGIQAGRRYPLVIYLHGAGQSGNDKKHVEEWADLLGPFLSTTVRRQYQPFVMAPQCQGQWVDWPWEDGSYELSRVPESRAMRAVRAMIAAAQARHPIDPDRIYVVGWSMGGFGAWDMIARTPEMFAAAVPVMGGGPPGAAPRMRNVAVWAFHNADDSSVPPHSDREMFLAMARAGARPIYTEGTRGGHFVFRAPSHPGLMRWLFAQRRGVPTVMPPDLGFTPGGGAFPSATRVQVATPLSPVQVRVSLDGNLPARGAAPLNAPREVTIERSAILIASAHHAPTGEDFGPEDETTTYFASPYIVGGVALPGVGDLSDTGGAGPGGGGGEGGEVGGVGGQGGGGGAGGDAIGASGGRGGTGGGADGSSAAGAGTAGDQDEEMNRTPPRSGCAMGVRVPAMGSALPSLLGLLGVLLLARWRR